MHPWLPRYGAYLERTNYSHHLPAGAMKGDVQLDKDDIVASSAFVHGTREVAAAITLPEAGEYILIASTFEAEQEGRYIAQLYVTDGAISAAAPLTRCGCDMDVQTFTAPSDLLSKGGHSTGSSNVALAARFGTVLITILGSDRSIHIHDASTDPPTDVPMTYDEWGSSDQKDALEAKYGIRQRGASLKNGKPRNSRGWRVAVPGGGARASRLRAVPRARPCWRRGARVRAPVWIALLAPKGNMAVKRV